MPNLTTPANIFEHTIDVLANYDTTPGHRLDKTAYMADAVTIVPYGGRVGHFNASGEWEMGCAAKKVPGFFMPPSVPYGHQPTLSPYWQSIGRYSVTGLVATGGFEIETTEYDSEQDFVVGDWLTAKVSNTDQDTGGVLTNVVPGTSTALTAPWVAGGTTKTLCGQVTHAPQTRKNGNSVLAFWTVFFPGTTDA